MNARQFLNWTRGLWRPGLTSGPRLLEEAVALLEEGVEDAEGSERAYESSLASGRGPSVVKLIQLHAYPAGLPERRSRPLERRKADSHRRVVEALNRAGRHRFSTAAWEAAREVLEDGGDLRACHKLGLEFDAASGRCLKATRYGLVREPERLERLASVLGVELPRSAGVLAGPELDCLGVDFFPDGTVELKLYWRRPLGLAGREEPEGAQAWGRLNAGLPLFPWVGTLLRFAAKGAPRRGAKLFFRLRRSLPAGRLAGLAPLAAHARFWKGRARRLAGLRVAYLALDGLRVEAYLRRSKAAWEN